MDNDRKNEEIKASHVILDVDMSPDRLDRYLSYGREEDELDFKEFFEWGQKASKDKLEFVKDAVAMANTLGGYIIYGVREDTGATPRFSLVGVNDDLVSQFDTSRLKDLIEKYVGRRIEILCNVVESKAVPGRRYGVVFIKRFHGGFAVPFEADGQYAEKLQGKQRTVFSRGEIWVRRGTKSIRAQAEDMERLESEFRRREQTIWLEQHFQLSEVMHRVNALLGTAPEVNSEATGKITPITKEPDQTYFMEPFPELRERYIEVLETNNDVLIRRWLWMPRDTVFKLVKDLPEANEEQQRLMDNVILPVLDGELTMGITNLEFEQNRYFGICVDVYRDIYLYASSVPEGKRDNTHPGPAMSPVIFWREVILRVFILGAAAIKYARYEYLPALIKQTPYKDDYWEEHAYWARHALTMLARANLLKPKSLCEMARPLAERLNLVETVFGTDEELKTCLAQFDFIQAITAVHRAGRVGDMYPSFGVYYAQRVVNLVRDLFRKGAARLALPEMDDSDLKKIIRELDRIASREFFFGGWDATDWPNDLRKTIYED